MPTIDHKYGQTYYQRRGRKSAKGIPLVCLHGGPGGHSHFMTDLFELSSERQVYIYDQVGGGRSSATPKKDWRVKTFVDELKILVDAWGLQRFHLLGASWGTTLALECYFSSLNSKIESLVFQSPLFSTADWERDANKLIHRLPSADRKIIQYCHEIGATDSAVYRKTMATYYARHVCRNKARRKLSATVKNPNGNSVYQHMWGASEFHATGTLKKYDRVTDLARISCPTLIICGEHDEAQPATGKRYSKIIPDAQFTSIKGASHAILAERPKQLIKTIGDFIKE